ncbi:probable RNA-directed DNA polymerase from transposon BS isoform X1 [Cylas formicarius]|uniref:probable RNA-directed DNA polymerase from transposon BS isoform X1 n=1 Tax=Cylas formicarius TaxID=197179 RepID=UPI002958765F|nr:probable RNA-directed DNA polymerase from transposon BS isoform X1 [Cylas formicarius]
MSICLAYNSPHNMITLQDMDTVFSQSQKVLLAGDLNARHVTWNNHVNNRNGLTIFNYATHNLLAVHTSDTPTHYPINGTTPTFIDIVVNKDVTNFIPPVAPNVLPSDHSPLVFQVTNVHKEQTDRPTYVYKNVDWRRYRHILNQTTTINPNIQNVPTLEKEVEELTANIQNARNIVARKVILKPLEDRLPDDIVERIRMKNSVRKRWQRTRRPQDRQQYLRLQDEIRVAIYTHKNRIWADRLEALSSTDKSLWRLTKCLRRSFPPIPTLEGGHMTDLDKAECLAAHLRDVHTPAPNTIEDHRLFETEAPTVDDLPAPEPAPNIRRHLHVTLDELRAIIKTLPYNKAPGPDNISNILLRNLPRKAIIKLLYILKAVLVLQHFPAQWKKSIVIPICKPGKDPKLLNSYRPISLLNTMSKVAERIILTRINNFAEKQNLTPEFQFGFRKGRSTLHPVAKLAHETVLAFNRRMLTVATLLDMEKAFDTVWHNGLLYKLGHVLNFPPNLTRLIGSYLQGRTFSVRVNNTLSVPGVINAGVPQGTVLAPRLYTLYIADIPTHPKTQILQYADDTIIYSHSHRAEIANRQILFHLRSVLPFFQKWKLKLNPSKTEQIILTRKFFFNNDNRIIQKLNIHNTIIEPKTRVNYLGFTLDQPLKFGPHINRRIQQTSAAIHKLYPLTCRGSALSIPNKILIFKTILRPILLYGAPIFGGAAQSHFTKLQRFQNKILRHATNKGRYIRIRTLHEISQVPHLRDYINTISDKFFRVQIHQSPLTTDITNRRHIDGLNQHKLLYQHLPLFNEDI